MRKGIIILLSALMAVSIIGLALPGCAEKEAAPAAPTSYHWMLHTNVGPEWPPGTYIQELKKEIEESSNGRILIDLYYAEELGDWVWVMEQVSRGEVQMASNPVPTEVDPRLNITHVQYVFLGYEGAKKALGPGGTLMGLYKDLFADSNWYLLGTFPTGAYGVSTKEKIVRSPDDAKGIKLRVMPVKACEYGLNARKIFARLTLGSDF